MKRIFDTKIKKIILLATLALAFFMQFFALLTPLRGSKKAILNSGSFIIDTTNYAPLMSMFFVIFLLVNLGFVIAGIILILREKKKDAVYLIPNFIINLVMIVLSNMFKVFNAFGTTLIVFSMIFSLATASYLICEKVLNKEPIIQNDENKVRHRPVQLLAGLSLLVLFITLFIPFALVQVNGSKVSINPLVALFSSSNVIENVIVFVLIALALIISFPKFLALFNQYENEAKFYKKAKNYIFLNYAFSLLYFVGGLVYSFVINIIGFKCNTVSYIPCILITIIAIVFSVFYGKEVERFASVKQKAKPKSTVWKRIEIDFYVILFTVVTALTLLLDIFVIKYNIVDTTGYINDVTGSLKVNGFEIIRSYATLGKKMQFVALLIGTLLVVSVVFCISSIIASISKSKSYYRLALFSVVLNICFTFLIGLFGKYFEIAQQIDIATIKNIIESNNFPVDIELIESSSEITVTSQSFYMFLIDAVLLFFVLCRAPLSKLEKMHPVDDLVFDAVATGNGEVNNNFENNFENSFEFKDTKIEAIDVRNEEEAEEIKEEIIPIPTFDACPAFTELDKKYDLYQEDFETRQLEAYENPTLQSLVRFVVNYARDSRLHLFYSYEDIATFIAGLGSSRLSILQGMSGTGKTSLPKIFMEAIMGNCEIVEVESSWRDKNELLGYYNEFSKNYTPKKFTQALYKAKLNDNIMTFIVLDEMNLSRIEYYFSDFLSLMENEEDKRMIKLLNVKIFNDYDNEHHSYLGLSEDHTLKIPHNVYFIGTANKDESTFEISDKVYDRAMTMNFNTRAKTQQVYAEEMKAKFVSYEQFETLINEAKQNYEFSIDDNPIVKEVEQILLPYNISFGNRIARQIESFVKVYCSCFENPKANESSALEIILLSKVVAKLENKSIDNKEELVATFERLKLFRCSKFIAKLNED